MAQFMGDGEGSAEPVVLTDAAAPVRITHRPQLGEPCVAREPGSVFPHDAVATQTAGGNALLT